MSAEQNPGLEKDIGPAGGAPNAPAAANGAQHAPHPSNLTAEEQSRFGYGPLSHVNTKEAVLRPFGGEFQPGLYKSVETRKFANPAPLGLSAFALTTFVLSAINMGARDITEPNIVIALAFGYGGLVQLLAGMWEMAVGNTFGATALSSYGGFWLSFAIVLTPGGFQIESGLEEAGGISMFYNSFGLFLMGWFIFTTVLLFCTLRSTVAFFLLFFFLDLAFLLLGIGYIQRDSTGAPNPPVIKAGGFFGLMAAFAAWYNALAGIADSSNSFFVIPVAHFPWSPTGRARRNKTDRETV
ncbi:acetate permease A [Aspergillus californicus]